MERLLRVFEIPLLINKETNMKKILSIIIICALSLSIAACTADEYTPVRSGEETTAVSETTEEAPEEVTPQSGEWLSTKNFSIFVFDGWEHDFDEPEEPVLRNLTIYHEDDYYSAIIIEVMSIRELSEVEGFDFTTDSTQEEIFEALYEYFEDEFNFYDESELEYIKINGVDALKIINNYIALGDESIVYYVLIDKVNIYVIMVGSDNEERLADMNAMLQTFTLNPDAIEVESYMSGYSEARLNADAKNIYNEIAAIITEMEARGEELIKENFVLISDGTKWEGGSIGYIIADRLNERLPPWNQATVYVAIDESGWVTSVIYDENGNIATYPLVGDCPSQD
jgi:hypothetical protein